jgi:PBP1b-binding outer membrane lipoprotein LpoB
MLKRTLIVCALATAVLAGGCASVQMASPEQDTAAKSFAVKPGKANIYVYRNETFGAALKMPIVLDGKAVGDTASKTYLVVEVAPGAHTVISKTENDSSVNVNAVAGRNYFLWQEVKMGLMTARSDLKEVDEATGKAGVAECKLIQVMNF